MPTGNSGLPGGNFDSLAKRPHIVVRSKEVELFNLNLFGNSTMLFTVQLCEALN